MGIGHEWNDIFLDALAGKTGGTSVYISKPKDIERFLVEKFKSLTHVFADEVSLDFRVRDGVAINFAFRLQPEGGSDRNQLAHAAGRPDIAKRTVAVLLELLVPPMAQGMQKVAMAQLFGGRQLKDHGTAFSRRRFGAIRIRISRSLCAIDPELRNCRQSNY